MSGTLTWAARGKPTRRMAAGGFGAGTLGSLQASPVKLDGRCHAHHAVDPTIRPALARMSRGAVSPAQARAITAALPESAFPLGRRPRNVRLAGGGSGQWAMGKRQWASGKAEGAR